MSLRLYFFPGPAATRARTQMVYGAVANDREYPGAHACPLNSVASRRPPHFEERLLHEVFGGLALPHHSVGQRVCHPTVAVVERREGLGISTVGQGYQVLVCQKQVLSILTHYHNTTSTKGQWITGFLCRS